MSARRVEVAGGRPGPDEAAPGRPALVPALVVVPAAAPSEAARETARLDAALDRMEAQGWGRDEEAPGAAAGPARAEAGEPSGGDGGAATA